MASTDARTQLTIRPAREADAVMLREIYNEAIEDGMVTFASGPRTIEEQQRLIAESLQDPRHPMIVAEVLNWTCGLTTVGPHAVFPQFDDVAEIQIFVRRSFRSYGVGRQLMRAVQAEVARLGYRKLIGQVLSESQDTLRLCQSTGWRVVGQYERHARHGDSLHDVTIVEFHVPPPQNAGQ